MKLQQSLSVRQTITLTPSLRKAINLLPLSHLDLLDEILKVTEENPFVDYCPPSYYQQSFLSKENHYDIFSTLAKPKSLEEHLIDQLISLKIPSHLEPLVLKAVLNLNDAGLMPAEERESLSTKNLQLVQYYLKQLEPYGIGAPNLQQCLIWQLESRPELEHEEMKETLKQYLLENFTFLLEENNKLSKTLGLDKRETQSLIALLQKLYFRPALEYKESAPQSYIVPDLLTEKKAGSWQVSLNEEILPKLSLYGTLGLEQAYNKKINVLNNEAKWFIKTVHNRHHTLLKVANAIVTQQQDFLNFGPLYLKPLILEDLALITGFHESTISRVTTNKYIFTQFGLYELKGLLSRGLKKENGEIASTTSIKALIKDMINYEDTRNPLSDKKIAEVLTKQGFQIARRTIAKYREILDIGSSTQRKRRNKG